MNESSFEDEVLGELGDDRLTEIASLLGTDTAGARDTVATTVAAMTGDLRQRAAADDEDGAAVRRAFAEVSEPPRGTTAGVPTGLSRPVANAVAKKTGIPAPTVGRLVEILIPVVLAVFAKRAGAGGTAGGPTGAGTPAGGASGAGPAGPGGAGGGLADLLGRILGGGGK
ncbi:DUF937 domain-containing protein [Streptomyces sp. NRRL F-2664]|uniref:DUF937 domain-containing protein n=1 Tax=Streptomyces sp. NRRL F-2664 TaxID=1463842 RepID=UPI0005B987CC|nr:DUF937 domain-containing protein [Streptomyces sp. NRRL F-2664]